MTEHGVPCAPVVELADVRRHPQVVASGVLEETEHPALGRIIQPRPAARMSGIDESERSPAPAAGEHTDEILAEAGLAPTEISDLRTARRDRLDQLSRCSAKTSFIDDFCLRASSALRAVEVLCIQWCAMKW